MSDLFRHYLRQRQMRENANSNENRRNRNARRVRTQNTGNSTNEVQSPTSFFHPSPSPLIPNNHSFLGIGNQHPPANVSTLNSNVNTSLQNPLNLTSQPLNNTLYPQTMPPQRNSRAPSIFERIAAQRRERNQSAQNSQRTTRANPIQPRNQMFQRNNSNRHSNMQQMQQPLTIFSTNLPSHPQILPNRQGQENFNTTRKIFNPNPNITSQIIQTENRQQIGRVGFFQRNSFMNTQLQRIPEQANLYPTQNQYFISQQNQREGLNQVQQANNCIINQNEQIGSQVTFNFQPQQIYNPPNFYQQNINNIQNPFFTMMNQYCNNQQDRLFPNLNLSELIGFKHQKSIQFHHDPEVFVPQNHIELLQNLEINPMICQDNFNPFSEQQTYENNMLLHLNIFPNNFDSYEILKYFINQQISNNKTTNIYLILDRLKKIVEKLNNSEEEHQYGQNEPNFKVKDLKHLFPYFCAIRKWQSAIKSYLNQLRQQSQILKQRNLQKMQQKLLKFKKFGLRLKKSNDLIKQIEEVQLAVIQQTKSTMQLYQGFQTHNESYTYTYPDQGCIQTVKIIAQNYFNLHQIVNHHELLYRASQSILTGENHNVTHAQVMKLLIVYFTNLCGEFADLKQLVTRRLKDMTKLKASRTEQSKREWRMFKLLRQIDQIIAKKKRKQANNDML